MFTQHSRTNTTYPTRIAAQKASLRNQKPTLLLGFSVLLLAILALTPPMRGQENTAAEAEQLTKKAGELYKQGKYADAEALMKRSLAIQEKVLGPEDQQVAMDKHQALLAAQEDERNTVQRRYKSDLPYYWGAFVLVGR
jgi:hypothetical protein